MSSVAPFGIAGVARRKSRGGVYSAEGLVEPMLSRSPHVKTGPTSKAAGCRTSQPDAPCLPRYPGVGIRIATFEACSGFTRVTAHWLAQPRKRSLSPGLPFARSPEQAACQRLDQTGYYRGGTFPPLVTGACRAHRAKSRHRFCPRAAPGCSSPGGQTRFFWVTPRC
jgi:hypothetical protein